MSQKLIEESPVILLPSLAVAIGLAEALILQQIYFWQHNPIKDVQLGLEIEIKAVDGQVWVRIDPKMFLDKKRGRLRFMSESTWRRALASCKSAGVLHTRNLNSDSRDTTNWYWIDVEAVNALGANKEAGSQFDSPGLSEETTGTVNMTAPRLSKRTSETVTVTAPYKDIEKTTEKKEKTAREDEVVVAPSPSALPSKFETEGIALALKEAGISIKTARELATQYPDRAKEQLEYLPFRNAKDKAAMLRMAIEEDWSPPKSYEANGNGHAAPKAPAPKPLSATEKLKIISATLERLPESLRDAEAENAQSHENPLTYLNQIWPNELAGARRELGI